MLLFLSSLPVFSLTSGLKPNKSTSFIHKAGALIKPNQSQPSKQLKHIKKTDAFSHGIPSIREHNDHLTKKHQLSILARETKDFLFLKLDNTLRNLMFMNGKEYMIDKYAQYLPINPSITDYTKKWYSHGLLITAIEKGIVKKSRISTLTYPWEIEVNIKALEEQLDQLDEDFTENIKEIQSHLSILKGADTKYLQGIKKCQESIRKAQGRMIQYLVEHRDISPESAKILVSIMALPLHDRALLFDAYFDLLMQECTGIQDRDKMVLWKSFNKLMDPKSPFMQMVNELHRYLYYDVIKLRANFKQEIALWLTWHENNKDKLIKVPFQYDYNKIIKDIMVLRRYQEYLQYTDELKKQPLQNIQEVLQEAKLKMVYDILYIQGEAAAKQSLMDQAKDLGKNGFFKGGKLLFSHFFSGLDHFFFLGIRLNAMQIIQFLEKFTSIVEGDYMVYNYSEDPEFDIESYIKDPKEYKPLDEKKRTKELVDMAKKIFIQCYKGEE